MGLMPIPAQYFNSKKSCTVIKGKNNSIGPLYEYLCFSVLPSSLPSLKSCVKFYIPCYNLRNSRRTMNESVLVLNANFAPINVCTTRRAIGLLLTGKASMVMNGRGVINTVSVTIEKPSVIRLGRMVKRPRPRVKLSKREIFRRDNYTCQYCGSRDGTLTLDHVIPRRLGGIHSWKNLVTACAACNHHKGGRTAEQAGMKLRRLPTEPSSSATYIFARHVRQNMEWEPYLMGW
jgi:5-methylcytosine-specific restriction endonuclease McrA